MTERDQLVRFWSLKPSDALSGGGAASTCSTAMDIGAQFYKPERLTVAQASDEHFHVLSFSGNRLIEESKEFWDLQNFPYEADFIDDCQSGTSLLLAEFMWQREA